MEEIIQATDSGENIPPGSVWKEESYKKKKM
jgi:hypothetical protein